ncbi:MAG: acyl-CoA dehydrogenase family protein [Chloroflexi bacterium]|nr:acyl-CoA dehydrogenase family protein [Chloroflexota bacterium]
MDWTDTQEQQAFAEDVRALIERMPKRYREMSQHDWPGSYSQWARDRISEQPGAKEDAAAWLAEFAGKGWVAPHWPQEYGGGGLSPMEQFIFNREIATANAPGVGSNVGIGMLGPALIVHGTEEQKKRFLPPILAGEVVWAQGFSEPGAGSDLASLQTRAVRDGDDYVINGQKIWTTHGHYADWVLLLTRTDPDAPKHRGISFLLVDKYSPGVTVRPIIDMSWGHEVNETFFEDVRIPADQIVGEENRGWYVAMTLLDNERSNIAGAVRMERTIRRLLAYIGTDEGRQRSRVADLDSLRQRIAQHFVEAGAMLNFSLRIITMQSQGQVPNYEASVSKLFGSEVSRELDNDGVKVFGLYGNLWDADDPRTPFEARFTKGWVRGVPGTIAGGSSEIQRNVIATRGLGLPRG